MAKRGGVIGVEGLVVEALPSAMFRVELNNGHVMLAHTSGKMRRCHIRIFPESRVIMGLSPYDLSRGRIVYRYKWHAGPRSRRRNIMEVKPSVEKICDNCRVVHHHGRVVVVYENLRHKQCQG